MIPVALALAHAALALLWPPLLLGLIGRVKARLAGRVGPPLVQPYRDLWKLLQKGSVYSRTTSWLFRAGPVVGLAAVLCALLILPVGGRPGPLSFPGDFVALVYLLGVARFFTVLAALDTGSSFEGMGAAREVTFSSLAEPGLFFCLLALGRMASGWSLSRMISLAPASPGAGPALVLVGVALLVIALAENARIPVDDPATHLELTMIHEVMVLDHGGPDLALISYGAALKLFVFLALIAGLALPPGLVDPGLRLVAFAALTAALAVAIGLVESLMARLRLVNVPQLLVGAAVLSGFGLILVLR